MRSPLRTLAQNFPFHRTLALSHPINTHVDRSAALTFLHCSSTHFSNGLERWTCIDGFSGFEASTFGNIRNIKHAKLRTINNRRFKSINARPTVNIKSDTGKWITFGVNRLVLCCFHPRDDADNLFAVHIDGDKYNNHFSNLKWSDKIYKYQSKTSQ
eukprot:87604_1